ncbi:hypothetical protein A8C32_04305 [Flavivirga aquatica]|uniref:DUF2867 domain-containing protein n=1 Tax=Flavivirga aquatica TaxID=1849968 RepID=A0A1E5SH51_9FLAO|nr:DUF2867 domain-containing protein [Flavivirga aquatica]OEJ98443.1 hypothetical protein A8C32_04305 [Flavivirga aquatica]
MKKVKEESTELTEDLKKWLSKIDFSDTFLTTNHTNNIEEIVNLVFNTTPKWIALLFKLRNKIACFIGLKTKEPDDYNEDFKVGGYIKFFKIYFISENEVVLGADDSHLNFRAITNKSNSDSYNIKVTTLVEYNNIKGEIYMRIIKPFHEKVVKRMVKNAYVKNDNYSES